MNVNGRKIKSVLEQLSLEKKPTKTPTCSAADPKEIWFSSAHVQYYYAAYIYI